jgi:3-hydroxyacyl-[acyl-carrier-protein] dehydratase
VLLIESMAQAGVVALGLYLVAKESGSAEMDKLVTVFTDVNVEFTGRVLPGERVHITGRKVYFRRRKLRSQVEMRLDDGSVVCAGTLSGMGVPR